MLSVMGVRLFVRILKTITHLRQKGVWEVRARGYKQEQTFLIKVLDKQHGTWQGSILWAEGKKEQYFRSALELLKLIDEAVSQNEKGQEEAAMKSKMRKKMIAFLLCMVLVICNSVSILADTPAEATTTVEKQTKQTGAVKETGSEAEKKEIKAGDADDTSGRTDSGSSDEKKTDKEDSSGSGAPETKTTEEKEDTTKATTEEKEDSGKADEVTTEEKKDSDKADEVTAEAKEESDKTSEATTAAETTEKDDTDAAGEDGNKTSKTLTRKTQRKRRTK